MQSFIKLTIIFLAVIGATALFVGNDHIEFGRVNFWHKHNIFFLFFIALFPRLTLLFSSVAFGGFFGG